MKRGHHLSSNTVKPGSGFIGKCWQAWRRVGAAFIGVMLCGTALAGVMTREAMVQAFPSPLIVGEKDRDLPVWPILKQDATSTPVVAWAFESIDFAPVPGFSGTPINLLVLLDGKGQFWDVRVLSQHEPVFLDGLGPLPLQAFVKQYKGLSLQQNIKIGSGQNRTAQAGSANVYINGVAKATASVRILNQSLLSASLKVARAKLGYGQGHDPDQVGHLKLDLFAPLDWSGLQKAQLLTHLTLSAAQVNRAFADTAVAQGQDELRSTLTPGDASLYLDAQVAWLDLPAVGRNLLDSAGWEALQRRLEPGDHALLWVNRGRYSLTGPDFVRGSVPDRLTLQQQHLPVEMRDLDFDVAPVLPADWQGAEWRVFRVNASAGLDPSQPLDFALHVTRSKGVILPEHVRGDFPLSVSLPETYVEAAQSDNKTWVSIWRTRWWELGVLALGLGVLVWALRLPPALVQSPQRLRWFRTAYLLFTLGFIGWFAQGQLSVVNLTALIQALLARRSLDFFLYDPMTVSLWLFVAVSFYFWGRGTFCGWLCPFGALQELTAQLAQRLKIPRVRVPERWDRALKKLKYGVLAVILLCAGVSVTGTDALVEIEPFKTSITLNFVREWPFVVWAAVCVLSSGVVYKGYCRYLCPLGAGMAALGRWRLLRRFDWIARRAECGQPCQRCRHDCAYQAIEKSGAVDYDECFQCLDCVVIYESPALCVPLILADRSAGGRSQTVIPIQVQAG